MGIKLSREDSTRNVPPSTESSLHPHRYNWLKIFQRKKNKNTSVNGAGNSSADEESMSRFMKRNAKFFEAFASDSILIHKTHFHPNEYNLLKQKFKRFCMGHPETMRLARDEFTAFLYSSPSQVFHYQVAPLSEDQEFITSLSISLRGSYFERVLVAFRIYDHNDRGVVEKKEVMKILEALDRCGLLQLPDTSKMEEVKKLVEQEERDRNESEEQKQTGRDGDISETEQHQQLEPKTPLSPQYQKEPEINENIPPLNTLQKKSEPLCPEYLGYKESGHGNDVTHDNQQNQEIPVKNPRPIPLNHSFRLQSSTVSYEPYQDSIGDEKISIKGKDKGKEAQQLDLKIQHMSNDKLETSSTEEGGKSYEESKDRGKRISLMEAHQLVDTFFAKEDCLPMDVFEQRMKSHLYMMNGFGVVEMFFLRFYQPIYDFLHSAHPYEKTGYLQRIKNRYYHEIHGGVLRRYKDHSKKVEYAKRAITLRTCLGVEELIDRPCSFVLVIDKFKRKLFTASSPQEKEEWVNCIILYLLSTRDNRYNSFAPVRTNVKAKWFVDGKDVFEDMMKAMLLAKSQIMICGWGLIPYLYLTRDGRGFGSRLDRILRYKAQENVKIFVLLWKEKQLAGMNLESEATKKYLELLHPNIKCVTHPKRFPLEYTHHQKSLVIDQQIAYVGGFDLCWGRYDDNEHRLLDLNHCFLRWPGCDYGNAGMLGGYPKFTSKLESFKDCVDRDITPRMPWHDVHCRITGSAVADVTSNFISRWNHHIKQFNRNEQIEISFPKNRHKHKRFFSKFHPEDHMNSISRYSVAVQKKLTDFFHGEVAHRNYVRPQETTNRHGDIMNEKGVEKYNLPSLFQDGVKCNVQIVRSIDVWSGGPAPETSIYESMLDLISKAQHFIYIENQFFISSTAGGGIRNTIVLALIDKLRWAIQQKKVFRVIVVVPVHPEGSIFDPSIQQIMKWQFRTINRSETSILEVLSREFPNVHLKQYISFYCLRNYDFFSNLDNKPVYEQVYVHSKLMIVDDKYTIIGSANINDRSLLGTRDSELAIVIKDTEFVMGRMNGKRFKAGKYSRSLRIQLWREHLGLLSDELERQRLNMLGEEQFAQQQLQNRFDLMRNMSMVWEKQLTSIEQGTIVHELEDPISDGTYNKIWMQTALRNDEVFREVFPVISRNDMYATLEEYAMSSKQHEISLNLMSYQEKKKIFAEQRKKLQENIRGFLCIYPLDWLKNETFAKTGTLQLLSDIMWQ